jgi:hypothetical protein
MALPTFLIIGAAKSGTTSLHYYLGLHPEVQMSALKETNFFCGPANGEPYALGRVESLEEYEALFDASVPVRGESSPTYTSHPFRPGTPQRIKALVPEAKLIYLVRDPVARTVSHYQHRVSNGGERRPLPEVLEGLSDPADLRDTCLSLYATQLDCYLAEFPAERILVVDQVDLLGDRAATLQRIFAFLGVDEEFTSPEFEAELLKSSQVRVYPTGYTRFVRRVVAPQVRRVPPKLRRGLRRSVEKRLFPPLQKATLDAETQSRLEGLFADEASRLRTMTGQSFSSWSV